MAHRAGAGEMHGPDINTAVLLGAAAWGFGARMGHYASAQQGRLMCLGGAVGALVAGASVALVNFAFGVGGTVH